MAYVGFVRKVVGILGAQLVVTTVVAGRWLRLKAAS